MNPTTQSCTHSIKLAYFVYNTKAVSVVAKDFLPIKEQYYAEGDTLRVPFWYAKVLFTRGVIDPIKELLEYEKLFNKTVASQKMNTKQLISIDPDFYFEFYDYRKHILKRESIRNEKSKRLKEFKDSRQFIIMSNIRTGISKSQLGCMSFEELLFYEHAIRAKNDPYCVYDIAVKNYDTVVEEDDEGHGTK